MSLLHAAVPPFAHTTRFHRFAARPLAYSDPRAASALAPFARARRFLEHLVELSADDWSRLAHHATSRAAVTDDAAQHAAAMFVTPARKAARDALRAEACRVVSQAHSRTHLDPSVVPVLETLVAAASFALVLRDLLPPELFERLYAPFAPASHETARGGGEPRAA